MAFSKGGTTSSGALSVRNDCIFSDSTERDAFFVANPTLLSADMYCSVSGELQKYASSAWVDVSATIKGDKGAAGDSANTDAVEAKIVVIDTKITAIQSDKANKADIDPRGISSDAFLRSNHTGTISSSDVSGLDSAISDITYNSTLKATQADLDATNTAILNKANTSDLTTEIGRIDTLNAEVETLQSERYDTPWQGEFDNAIKRDEGVPTPKAGIYCKQLDTGTYWFYSGGTWTNSDINEAGGASAAIYDPQNIAKDSFARENHTGQQSISTVNGLQAQLTALSNSIIQNAEQVALKAAASDLITTNETASALALTVAGKSNQSDLNDTNTAVNVISGKASANEIAANHANRDILDATTASYTAEDKAELAANTESASDLNTGAVSNITYRDVDGVFSTKSIKVMVVEVLSGDEGTDEGIIVPELIGKYMLGIDLTINYGGEWQMSGDNQWDDSLCISADYNAETGYIHVKPAGYRVANKIVRVRLTYVD